jgi:uncharacterized protein GlcG (DUF336 family)
MHKVVIVGGGIAGILAAAHLARYIGRDHAAGVLLIDHNFAHVWKPMLHTFAAGTANYSTQSFSFAMLAKRNGFDYWPGELHGLDRDRKMVELGPITLQDGYTELSGRTIPYDTLVLTIGSHSNDSSLRRGRGAGQVQGGGSRTCAASRGVTTKATPEMATDSFGSNTRSRRYAWRLRCGGKPSIPSRSNVNLHWLHQGKFVTVTLAEANRAISGALSHAASMSARVSVSVCAPDGHLIAHQQTDGAFAEASWGSIGKAIAVAQEGRPSGDPLDRAIAFPATGLSTAMGARNLRRLGGLPIFRQGKLQGAIGVSGASSNEEDENCARAGLRFLGDGDAWRANGERPSRECWSPPAPAYWRC